MHIQEASRQTNSNTARGGRTLDQGVHTRPGRSMQPNATEANRGGGKGWIPCSCPYLQQRTEHFVTLETANKGSVQSSEKSLSALSEVAGAKCRGGVSSATRLPWVLGIVLSGRLLRLEEKAVWPLMATGDYIICPSLSFVFRDNPADRGERGRSVGTCDLHWGQSSLFTSPRAANGFTACTAFALNKPSPPGRLCRHSQRSSTCHCFCMSRSQPSLAL